MAEDKAKKEEKNKEEQKPTEDSKDEKEVKEEKKPVSDEAKEEPKKEESKEEPEESVEIPAQFKDIVEKIEEMSVVDLAELVKVLEKKFGVSAVAPAAGGAAAGGEEKSSYNVVLKAAGGQKINVIKAVKEITGLGLKEAKDLVDGAPKPIKEGVKPDEAEEMKKKLEEVGAEVGLE